MNDGFVWWLILVGLAIGVAASWLLLVRLPRGEDDVDTAERFEEAAWISRVIEDGGGIAPPTLVAEVLELHGEYLRSSAGARPASSPSYLPPPADTPASGRR